MMTSSEGTHAFVRSERASAKANNAKMMVTT